MAVAFRSGGRRVRAVQGDSLQLARVHLSPVNPISTLTRFQGPLNPMRNVLLLTASLVLAGSAVAGPSPPTKKQAVAKATSAAVALPKVITYKDPSCGCCGGWITHMRQHGFVVESENHSDMYELKEKLGVPMDKASCHTSKVGGLVIEGHVPAEDIKRLLARPDGAIGLAVPGMPIGSPGMEMPDGRKQPYTVERINRDGTTSPYASH